MKNKTLAAVMMGALLIGPFTAGAQEQEDAARTSKAGKIGCVVGGLAGGLLGTKLFKDNKVVGGVGGAAVGCAGGNFFGKKWSKAKQLKEFKEAQAQAQAAGMTAEVRQTTGTEDGKQVQQLEAMVIAYNPTDMQPVGQSTAQVFDKIAGISNRAKNQLTFTFTGTKACEVPFVELGKRGAFNGQGVQHKVDMQCGHGDSKLVISPLADIN